MHLWMNGHMHICVYLYTGVCTMCVQVCTCISMHQHVQPGHLGMTIWSCCGPVGSFISIGSSVSDRPSGTSCGTKGRGSYNHRLFVSVTLLSPLS